jgi:simple sugar transport system ATP-binding protein
MPDAPPLIEARRIVKRFGALTANDRVDLVVQPGEVHALLGENGAGKSTLVKILYGLLQPDEGQVLWQGAPVSLPNPRAARARGIGMVFQHFSLFEAMTVAENVALALDRAEPLPRIAERLAEVSRAYGLPLDPRREIWRLSVGERGRDRAEREREYDAKDERARILEILGDLVTEAKTRYLAKAKKSK